MKITKSGTLEELMQKTEKATGEVVAVHHIVICNNGEAEHYFNVFIGDEVCKRCASYQEIVRYLNSFLSPLPYYAHLCSA